MVGVAAPKGCSCQLHRALAPGLPPPAEWSCSSLAEKCTPFPGNCECKGCERKRAVGVIRCLEAKPGSEPVERMIPPTLESLHAAIGGYFTALPIWALDLPHGVCGLVQEGDCPGQLERNSVPVNFRISAGQHPWDPEEAIRGILLVVAFDSEGSERDMTEDEVTRSRQAIDSVRAQKGTT